MRMISVFICFILAVPALAAEQTFTDVPPDHWAAESVQLLADSEIINGYPDKTYQGEKYVTRYELAVALANFVQFIQKSEQPLRLEEKGSSLQPKTHWGKKSMQFLRNQQFIAKDSPLLTSGEKSITQEELAQALASVAARLVELRTPDTVN